MAPPLESPAMSNAGAATVAPPGASSNPILTFVQDSGNDLLGHTITTLSTLEVDPANPQASQPAPICETLNNEFNASVFNGIGMLGSNGHLALMFAPMVVKPSIFGQHNHPDEGKFVAILGDLYQGNHHDYYVKTQNPCPFERISNNVLPCLAADAIHAAAQAHTGANLFAVGPHATADPGVTATATRKIFKIPFFLLQHFLAIPNGVDVALYFWRTIFPLMLGREVELNALIDFFRVATTLEAAGNTRRVVWNTEDNMPAPIGRNITIMQIRNAALKRNFSSVFANATAAAQTHQMGAMAAAQDESNRIALASLEFHKEQKATAKMDKIRKVLGSNQQEYLLNALGKPTLADLPKWIKEALDTSPKDTDTRDRILQRELKKIAWQEGVEEPSIMHGTVDRILTDRWYMESDDAPETGSLCNLFLWGPPKGMAKQSQEMARLHANENISVTKAEQVVLEKCVLFFMHLDNMEKLINDGYILWPTMTGRDYNHPVVRFLGAYRGKISMNRTRIERYPVRYPAQEDIRGILIQIHILKHLEEWSKDVELGVPPAPLNDRLIDN